MLSCACACKKGLVNTHSENSSWKAMNVENGAEEKHTTTFATHGVCVSDVPSMARALIVIFLLSRFASATCCGSLGSTNMQTWKLPSPAWAKTGAGRSTFSSSALVSDTQSARRESGTQTSWKGGSERGRKEEDERTVTWRSLGGVKKSTSWSNGMPRQ